MHFLLFASESKYTECLNSNFIPSLPSVFPSFLLSFLPFSLFLVSSFLPFSFFDFRQWQLEIDPEFSGSFCHMFHWGGVIGETDCMKEITPILFFFLCNSRDYNPHLSSHFNIITWGEEQCFFAFLFFFASKI